MLALLDGEKLTTDWIGENSANDTLLYRTHKKCRILVQESPESFFCSLFLQ